MWGINGVAMAPHGLILSQDGATASRNLFKYLPDSPEAIFGPKIKKNMKKQKNDPSLLSAQAGLLCVSLEVLAEAAFLLGRPPACAGTCVWVHGLDGQGICQRRYEAPPPDTTGSATNQTR